MDRRPPGEHNSTQPGAGQDETSQMKWSVVVRGALLVVTMAAVGCAEEGSELATPVSNEAALDDTARTLPQHAQVAMLSPQDGELVVGPLRDGTVAVPIAMALAGAQLAAAGDMRAGTGHHHVIVDAGPIAAGQPIPFDARHVHFGKGQSEAEVLLAPGRHRLTLQFADGAHRSYGPALASSSEILVEAAP
jgi:hypothetical protein